MTTLQYFHLQPSLLRPHSRNEQHVLALRCLNPSSQEAR